MLGQSGPSIFTPVMSIYDFYINANGTFNIVNSPTISLTGSLVGIKVGALNVNGTVTMTAVNPAVTYPSINLVATQVITFNQMVSLVGTTVQISGDGVSFLNGLNYNVNQAVLQSKSQFLIVSGTKPIQILNSLSTLTCPMISMYTGGATNGSIIL